MIKLKMSDCGAWSWRLNFHDFSLLILVEKSRGHRTYRLGVEGIISRRARSRLGENSASRKRNSISRDKKKNLEARTGNWATKIRF